MLYKESIEFTATTGSTVYVRTDFVQGYLKGIRYRPTTGDHYSTANPLIVTRNQSTASVLNADDVTICRFKPDDKTRMYFPARRMQGSTGKVAGSTLSGDWWPQLDEKILVTIEPATSTKLGLSGEIDFYIDGVQSAASSG